MFSLFFLFSLANPSYGEEKKEDFNSHSLNFYSGVFDYSDDKNYHLNNDIVYIGITNNPVQRLNGHRCDKGKSKKIGMVIFNEAKSPTQGKMLEAEAIYNYCEVKGHGPKFQKGHDTWAGA